MGQVRSFYGNFLVVVKALSYLLTLGKEGIPAGLRRGGTQRQLFDEAAAWTTMTCPTTTRCMHEFVMTLQGLAHDTGVTAMDVAKRSAGLRHPSPHHVFPPHCP